MHGTCPGSSASRHCLVASCRHARIRPSQNLQVFDCTARNLLANQIYLKDTLPCRCCLSHNRHACRPWPLMNQPVLCPNCLRVFRCCLRSPDTGDHTEGSLTQKCIQPRFWKRTVNSRQADFSKQNRSMHRRVAVTEPCRTIKRMLEIGRTISVSAVWHAALFAYLRVISSGWGRPLVV